MGSVERVVLASAIAAGGYFVYSNWDAIFGDGEEDQEYQNGRLKCDVGFSPVKQADGSWKCVRMEDPRDKDENKSLMDMDGKTLSVPNPNYNDSTNFGKLFSNYGLRYKVVIDYAGRTPEGSGLSSNMLVEFEPIPTSWTASGVAPQTIIRSVSSGTQWGSVQKPNFGELLRALGGVKTGGPYIGPQVSMDAIINTKPYGEVAMIPMTGQGKIESKIRLDIVTGRPNPAFTLGMYIRCGRGSYEWIQNSSSPIGGSYDEASNKWNYSVAIPASAMTALNAKCPPDVKTVEPPLEIGVDDGGTTSTGGISWTPYVLSGSPTTTTLTLDTTEKALLYSRFYSRSKPNVWRNASGQLIVKEQGIEVIIPHQYVKKTYECNCPSDSNKAGQKVQMPLPCSDYTGAAVSQTRQQELMTACGGKKSASNGSNWGLKGSVSLAESGSHQSFMTDFL